MEDAHRERVTRLIQKYVASGLNFLPAKGPDDDVENGGVPPAMWDGEPDGEGWVRWKPVPSTVTEADLVRLERRVGAALPPLLRAWLSAWCIGDLEIPARLPPLWSDGPLREVERTMFSWTPLERAGFLPIGDDSNDVGPICLDLSGPAPHRLVVFDHELLVPLLPEVIGERAQVAPLAIDRWPSFDHLLDELEVSLVRGPQGPP
jgi:hypothetical protein